MAALAIAMPWLAALAYVRVAELHESGSEGVLAVFTETGTSRSRRGLTTHYYDASIAGIRVRLSTSHVLSPGFRYPVLFSEAKLRDYASDSKGSFYSWKVGRKSESKWEIFVRDFGEGYLWLMAGLEALWISGAWLFWRSFKKGEDA